MSMRIAATVTVAIGMTLSACSPTASQLRGAKLGDTQVVVQWSLGSALGARGGFSEFLALNKCFHAESIVEKASAGFYFEDGNDIGGGLCNVYLFTSDVDETVRRLVTLEHAGKIPKGVQIGVAVYKDAARTDWTYRAVYPRELKSFSIF